MAQELWRVIPGYENAYIVSSFGNVMSLPRARMQRGKMRMYSGKVLKPRITPNGYLKVTLYKDGVPKQESVHRLVMLAFVGPSDLQVNHIDEDKTNNHIDNLEYLSGYDNTRYTCSKPVESYDLETGATIKWYASASDVVEDGHDSGAVSNVCLNKKGYRSHHGMGWRFAYADDSRENRADS